MVMISYQKMLFGTMGDCYMLTYILFTQFICKVIESL